MERTCLTIVLAAGEGKRMASALPKVLHPVGGLPMICHVVAAANAAGSTKCAVIVGNQAERVSKAIANRTSNISFFEQKERRGTAHAALMARPAMEERSDDVLVVNGDTPLVRPETINQARQALANGADIVVLGFETEDPTGYGRMIMQGDRLIAIREQKDASDDERKITFCNSGIIALRGDLALDLLDAIGSANAQSEFYLTDVVEIGNEKGMNVQAVAVPEVETLGVNDRVQLAEVERHWQARKRRDLMLHGVTMTAPETVVFAYDTRIERDVEIEPYVVFAPGVSVGQGATVRSFSHLEATTVGENAVVGPYARLRPGTTLGTGAKIGNFVETKNAEIADGAKVNHLSYIGDAKIGAKANIGAGTITCNYDGSNKHLTTIGQGAFIGTNTSLVAPVTIGDHAMTAAGSVVTEDVPSQAMAIERSPQKNIEGLAQKLRDRNAAIKARKSN